MAGRRRCAPPPPPPSYLMTLGGPGHAAIYASGVDVDPSGNVYVADTGNDQVKKYAPAGKLLWSVGRARVAPPGNFDNPRDVAYLKGKVYVADLGNKRVQVLDAATGAPLSVWTASFPSTIGISAGVDASGNAIILVTEDVLNQTRIYTPAGTLRPRDRHRHRRRRQGPAECPARRRHRLGRQRLRGRLRQQPHRQVLAHRRMDQVVGHRGRQGSASSGGPTASTWTCRTTCGWPTTPTTASRSSPRGGTYIRQMGSIGSLPGQFFQLRRVAVDAGRRQPRRLRRRPVGQQDRALPLRGRRATPTPRPTPACRPPTTSSTRPPAWPSMPNNIFVADSVNQRMQRFSAVRRLAAALRPSRLGHRPERAQLAAGHRHRAGRPRQGVGDRHQERPHAGVHPRRRSHRQVLRHAGPALRPVPPASARVAADAPPAWWSPTRSTTASSSGTPSARPRWSGARGGFQTPKDVAVSGGTVYVADTSHRAHRRSSRWPTAASSAPQSASASCTAARASRSTRAATSGSSDTAANRLVEFSRRRHGAADVRLAGNRPRAVRRARPPRGVRRQAVRDATCSTTGWRSSRCPEHPQRPPRPLR